MFVIIGLGNPGKDYERTRHNMGFLMVDCLQTSWKFPRFSLDKDFQAEISKGKWQDQDIILVKPQTFMNLSGQSAQAIKQFYKLTSQQFGIVYDELDLPWGKLRIRKEGSSAGHNGIKSIITGLGSEEFYRFRIGIKPESYLPGQERRTPVLERFSKVEEASLAAIFDQTQKAIESELGSLKI